MFRRPLQQARRRAWLVLPLLFGLGLLLVAAPSASAAGSTGSQRSVDIPFVTLCPKDAPDADLPTEGLIGIVGEKPLAPTNPAVADLPEKVWSNGGFAGMYTTPYDLGCAAKPETYAKSLQANADAKLTNTLLGIGYGMTSLTNSIDRRAWDASWITSFLQDFVNRATETVRLQVLIPLFGVGLTACTLYMLVMYRKGNINGAASGVAGMLLVLIVTALFLHTPTWAPRTTQDAGSGVVAALNGGSNAADAQTDRITQAVHYQGWLRRTFGTDESVVGKKYGPALLASERITWNEMASTGGDPEKIEALRKQKAKDFKDIAEKVKDEDPGAYRWLTGEKDGTAIAGVEALFSAASNFFRLSTAILLFMGVLLLAVLTVAFLALAPFYVTPPGQLKAIGMANAAVRCVGYVLSAAVGSWLFNLYLQAALQPGMSTWWSILLLMIGTVIGWTLIRPDRKALSLATMGRVNGTGALTKAIGSVLLGYVGGRVGGAVAAKKTKVDPPDVDVDITAPPFVIAAPLPVGGGTTHRAPAQPQTVYMKAYDTMDPERGLPSPGPREDFVEGEVVYDSADAGRVNTIYQRALPVGDPGAAGANPEPVVPPTPPPPGSLGEVEIYQRPEPGRRSDNEGSRS